MITNDFVVIEAFGSYLSTKIFNKLTDLHIFDTSNSQSPLQYPNGFNVMAKTDFLA